MKDIWFYAVAGLTSGGAYAITALGIVVTFRGSRVLNFAQGAMGMAGAFVFWELRYENGWSLYTALLLGVAFGAAVGAIVYGGLLRFMRNAGELPRVIVTLGVLLALQGAALLRYGGEVKTVRPVFGGGGETVWDAFISHDSIAVLIACLVAGVLAAVVFRWTRFGAVTTALGDNATVAATLGISPHTAGLVTWAAGGALGALAGCLLLPLTGVSPIGLTLIIAPSMAAALLGRFTVIPVTIAAGLALGVTEAVLIKFEFEPGYIRSIPFAVIVAALILRGRSLADASAGDRKRLPALGTGVINLRIVVPMVAITLWWAVTTSSTWAVVLVSSAVATLLALSLVVVTGYAGQLNLAPFALAGVSALVVAHIDQNWDLPYLVTMAAGVATAGVIGLLIGLPAVRVRGVNLAIATLGLAYAIESAVLGSPSLTGGVNGLRLRPPNLFGLDISVGPHPQRFAVFSVACAVVVGLAVANIRRGRSGRRYAAVRANERGASALGMKVANTKLSAFGLSAAIAGLAGALSVHRFEVATFEDYTTSASILALAFVVVGGIGSPVGAIVAGVITAGGIGTLFFERFFHFDEISSWLPMLTGLVVIDMMLRSPDGIVFQLFNPRRTRAAAKRLASRKAAANTTSATPMSAIGPLFPHAAEAMAGVERDTLTVRGLTVRLGATVAIDGVDLDVQPGRVVGVIGPNGAGKTTLVNAVTGFVRATRGEIRFGPRSVARMRPAQRSRLGLQRTFQQLELFDDMTVRENILTGSDDHRISAYLTDLVWPGRPELDAFGTEVAVALGLSDDLDERVADLPQGKRRLVAIARVIARRPAIVCLDEPAAGLSGPERRMLCAVIAALASDIGAGVLLIEHNVDVVAAVCEELVVLDFGRVIARGKTDKVLADPVVASAYLGARADTESGERYDGSVVAVTTP